MYDPQDAYPMVDLDSDREDDDSSDNEIDVILHGTPEQKRRFRRRSLGKAESSSEDEFEKEMEAELTATMVGIQQKAIVGAAPFPLPSTSTDVKMEEKVYDKQYFDSDEDDSVMKRKIPTNDDLLYDPDLDEKDQKWIDQRRQRYLPKQKQPKKGRQKPLPHSDAVLNCPACMSLLCLDCQKHSSYANQYRAMFVTNCAVDRTELLNYPRAANKSKKQKKKGSEETEEMTPAEVNSDDQFHPVRCVTCTTQVGVFDKEDVYHFFNVLSSYS
ncbi:hypothetical protein CAPTEDRAFT_21278 [Capitella teleta]|uniref:E2F-associated phosphoprotein n=1 Tax=Capitella teleta TaxID=283909 RepID=R7UJ41_CAPTE|nr:hypothetical protein CAPTEDRAFT_21278 [Capitella teleta]|eukprot:ELU06220.1 hypothetical protein CAPTEDRAFT_21278 [Capitella teleta]